MMAKKKRGQRELRRAQAKMRYYTAWTIICLMEAVTAAVPTAIMAALIIPLSVTLRGGPGFGGEYLLLAMTFVVTFRIIHYRTCDKVFGEEETRGTKRTGRKVFRGQHPAHRVG